MLSGLRKNSICAIKLWPNNATYLIDKGLSHIIDSLDRHNSLLKLFNTLGVADGRDIEVFCKL